MKTMNQVLRDHRDLLAPVLVPGRCGDGWGEVVEGALSELRQRRPGNKVTTIKQKLGRLVIYFDDKLDDTAKAIAQEASERSLTVCEVCGASGSLVDAQEGPARVRCLEHQDEW